MTTETVDTVYRNVWKYATIATDNRQADGDAVPTAYSQAFKYEQHNRCQNK